MSLIVVLTNISDLREESDYRFNVLVGDGTPERSKVIAQGEIKQHQRSKGWKVLVQRLLDETPPFQQAPSRT